MTSAGTLSRWKAIDGQRWVANNALKYDLDIYGALDIDPYYKLSLPELFIPMTEQTLDVKAEAS